MKAHASGLTVALILALFAALGIWYSLAVPPFETPDEIYHYAFARHLASGGALPVQTRDSGGPWAHEGTQAPLYYFLAGRLIAGIDQSDFEQLGQVNPYANLGNPLQPGGRNFTLYSARYRPLVRANLALHVGRWFSLALGLLSLWLVYLTARLALPGKALPLLALATAAAIPQFGFISASFSNDSLVTCMAIATVYWLARLLAREPEQHIAAWEWLFLGVLLGLAALSKLQGLGLTGLAILAILGLAWLRRSPRLLPLALPLVLAPLLAIAGWWYWRNHVLYGDWLGASELLAINGQRSVPLTWGGFLGEMRGLRYSFWALFGWFSILLPGPVYQVLDALTLAALGGLSIRLVKALRCPQRALEAPSNRVRLLLGAWVLLLIGLMVYWATFATSSQGRLLFPGLSAIATLGVLGLSTWLELLPRRRSPGIAPDVPSPSSRANDRARFWHEAGDRRFTALACLPIGLAACSVFALAVLFPTSYGPLTPVQELPQDARPVHLTIKGAIELVGISVPTGRFHAGERVPVTLYLRAREALTKDYPLFVQLLNDKREVIGNVTSHPGWGRFPTSLWRPGALYEDHYGVLIESNLASRSPVQAQIYTGFMDPDTRSPLAAVAADGSPATGMEGSVTIAPVRSPGSLAPQLQPSGALFGNGIRLAGYTYPAEGSRAEGHLPVTLLWQATEAPGADYTAFIHLVGPGSRQVSWDGPPDEGRFPTHLWQPGDQSLSQFDVPLPPDIAAGAYQVWLGVYPASSNGTERLPVQVTGATVQDQALLLGTVTVR